MLSEFAKKTIKEFGQYSEMKIDPIIYHGYKETKENLELILEEIDYEISVKPQFINNLLDHRFSLQNRLNNI